MTDNAILLVDSNRGVYIPKLYVERNKGLFTTSDVDAVIVLLGPDNEGYWDAWTNILNDHSFIVDGTEYILEHNEDLWAIPLDEWDQIPEM